MTTYLDMQTRIADELTLRTDLLPQIKLAIQSAILFYQPRRMPFSEAIGTFSTAAAKEYYTSADVAPNQPPQDIGKIQSVRALISGQNVPLSKRTMDYIDQISVNPVSYGLPYDYVYWAQSFRLYPIPSGVFVLSVAYDRNMTAPVNDTDVTVWTTGRAEELIRSRAKADIYANVIKDQANAGIAQAAEQIALSALELEVSNVQSTGRVTPTQF